MSSLFLYIYDRQKKAKVTLEKVYKTIEKQR